MLRKFTVRNYKNFKDTLTLDFGDVGGYKFNQDCIENDIICKCLIYGRNATGKTNLGEALTDICDIIFGSYHRIRDNKILNADSEEIFALFDYLFSFDDDNLEYRYRRNDKRELLSEVLTVNGSVVYDLDFKKGQFNCLDLSLIGADTIQTEKYTDSIQQSSGEIEDEESARVPFLRFVLNNAPMKADSILLKLEDYIGRIRISSVGTAMLRRNSINMSFVEYLSEDDNLSKFEEFLNIMGIECKLEVRKSADGQNDLFFRHNSLIPFYDNASSGTLALATLYRRVLAVERKPSLFYMDEFDAYYNYEMSEKIVRFFKKNYPESQIIMTTHNTNLMTTQLMRPDCLLILSRSGKITALCHATERELREGHNLEKLYIGGEFEKYE